MCLYCTFRAYWIQMQRPLLPADKNYVKIKYVQDWFLECVAILLISCTLHSATD